MSKSSNRKAVVFSDNDIELKIWAESRSEGFSSYVKRLIRDDQQNQLTHKNIAQAFKDVIASQEGQDALALALARALDGKILAQIPGEGVQANAASLGQDEIEQIFQFMSGR